MFRRLLCLILLACSQGALGQAKAGASPALEFDAAIDRAVRVAPTVRARQAATTAIQEDAARAASLPDPTLSGGLMNLTATGADAFDFAAADMTMKSIGVSQAFPARAKRDALKAVAERRADEALAATQAEQLDVRRQAAQAWLALWAAEQEAEELRQMRGQVDVAASVATARLRGGSGSPMDALAVRADALQLENRIAAAEARTRAERDGLARWLDLPSESTHIEGSAPDVMSLPVPETTLLGSLDRQGPLLPWSSREAVAEAQVDLALAQKKPDWSLGAFYGQRSGGRSDMVSLQFSIDLPLFSVNRQDRGIAARRADLDSVAAQREDARRAQKESVQRMLAQWEGLRQQAKRERDEMLPLAAERVDLAVASYRGGGELRPWLEARRDEIELRIEHARRLGELGSAWAALAFLLPDAGEAP